MPPRRACVFHKTETLEWARFYPGVTQLRGGMVVQFRSLSFFAVVLAVGFGWISVPPRANADERKTALPEYRTWIGDFDEMQKRRLIRFIVPYSKTVFFIDKGEQLGTAAEWGDEFDKWLNKGIKSELERIRIAFVPTPREQLLTALKDGRGDIVAANLTITPIACKKWISQFRP